jgi:Caspase domain/PAN domain
VPVFNAGALMIMRLSGLLCVPAVLGVAVSAILTVPARSQQPPNQVALIIGNTNYPDASGPITTAVNDARALAAELRHDNFDVDVKENVGKADMQRAIDAFTGRIRSGMVALFYFSGFGIQVARTNYLVPIDAQIWSEDDAKRDGISLDAILGEMNRRGARVKIVIVDASRRNPFERRFRSVATGLAALDAPQDTLAMYAAAPGAVASDGPGDKSLFAGELLRQMQTPNLTAEEIFNRTRLGVSRTSNNEQVPWVASSLIEAFSFGANPQVAAGPTSMPGPAPAPAPAPSPAPAAPTAGPPQPAPADTLVPEAVPFIPDRQRASIRADYLPAPDHKALAISFNRAGFTSGQADDETAKTAALDNCKSATEAAGSKNQCQLYAIGNTVVFRGVPPMPPPPWLVRNAAIERPFASKDLPLMDDSARASWDKNYPKAGKPKALALSPDGQGFYYFSVATAEEAVRRALEGCGYQNGLACMVVALDDNFVVPIPTTMKPVGFFHPGTNPQISPELRDSLARRLSGATNAWNAVAVGSNGRPGVMLNGTDEQDAIAGALKDCGRQDNGCRVIALGPFTVEASDHVVTLSSTKENNTDRPGLDYRNFNLTSSDPQLCQQACLSEKICAAWTYVHEGVQGPSPRCWLKNQVPNPQPNPCCVSGVVR